MTASASTVRQRLAHQAGLFAFDEHVDTVVVADLDRLCRVIRPQSFRGPAKVSLGFMEPNDSMRLAGD